MLLYASHTCVYLRYCVIVSVTNSTRPWLLTTNRKSLRACKTRRRATDQSVGTGPHGTVQDRTGPLGTVQDGTGRYRTLQDHMALYRTVRHHVASHGNAPQSSARHRTTSKGIAQHHMAAQGNCWATTTRRLLRYGPQQKGPSWVEDCFKTSSIRRGRARLRASLETSNDRRHSEVRDRFVTSSSREDQVRLRTPRDLN